MRLAALVAALGLATGLLAACSGGDAPGDGGSTPQSAPAERSTEAAPSAAGDAGADRAPDTDAETALESSWLRAAQVVLEERLERCRRLAEGNPDEAEAILEACESGEAFTASSTTVHSVVALNTSPNVVVGPPYVSTYGVGGFGALLMGLGPQAQACAVAAFCDTSLAALPLRLGPQEYRCQIRVTQHRTDEAAGEFSVTFSGDGLPEQTVELEGPSWTGEATLPAGGEGLREIGLTVQSDAEDAEWRVACSQRSG